MSNLIFEVVKFMLLGGEEDLVARAKQQVQKIKREIKEIRRIKVAELGPEVEGAWQST